MESIKVGDTVMFNLDEENYGGNFGVLRGGDICTVLSSEPSAIKSNGGILTVKKDDGAEFNVFARRFTRIECHPLAQCGTKDTNPKDAVGVKKWRQFTTVPFTVICELGVAMLEGARKYGRHNYRFAGVRSSVYIDAAVGHIAQWWEGEDIDPDSKLSHITKAIASLTVLRDAHIQGMLTDDRPPKTKNLNGWRQSLQKVVDELFEKYPEAKEAYTHDNTVQRTLD